MPPPAIGLAHGAGRRHLPAGQEVGEGRLAGVGQAEQADVGQHLQFQGQVAALAFLAVFWVVYDLICRWVGEKRGAVGGDALTGFVVAGDDHQWKPAQARLDGNRVVVSSPLVPKPLAARYAWENFPSCNLFNGAGLPASPFRTDDWP